MKAKFANDQEAYLAWRHGMEAELNSVHGVTIKGSDFQNGAVAEFKEASRSFSTLSMEES